MTRTVAHIGTLRNSHDDRCDDKSHSRPGRVDTPWAKIAAFHAASLRDGYWPACMACAVGFDSWRDLERAHIVDRYLGGLDGPQNLALLCSSCHAAFPDFAPGQEDEGWAWIRSRPNYWDQMLARAQGMAG